VLPPYGTVVGDAVKVMPEKELGGGGGGGGVTEKDIGLYVTVQRVHPLPAFTFEPHSMKLIVCVPADSAPRSIVRGVQKVKKSSL
jgi:hypothetical protein